jgi:hypothetical protein
VQKADHNARFFWMIHSCWLLCCPMRCMMRLTRISMKGKKELIAPY